MKTLVFQILIFCFYFGAFAQAASIEQKSISGPKMDILIVMDNSGTMRSSQQNIISNLSAFINKLKISATDYQIGVTTTDAYVGLYEPDLANKLNLLDGANQNHSGVFVVTPNTPNLEDVLATNLSQGNNGSGDERAFSSFEGVLSNPKNSFFRRSDANLAVLTISDEDDFSHEGLEFIEEYDNPTIVPVAYYADFLKAFAGDAISTFSTISVQDNVCLGLLNPVSTKIGVRYNQLAELTGGMKGDICNIRSAFDQFAQFVIDNAAEFPPILDYTIQLDRVPLAGTIVVKVNGRLILQDQENGWSFDPNTLVITLHGQSIPQKGDIASVTYDYQE